MRHLCVISALIALSGMMTVSGCGSTMIAAKEYMGIPKRDQMVARVQDARDSQNSAKQEFSSALDEFLAVTKVDGGDLEVKYKKFEAKYKSCDAAASTVRSRIADVERVSNALFAEWAKENAQINTPTLRAESESDLAKNKELYEKLLGSMKTAAGKMDKPLSNFKDQTIYLKHKLNAKAIAGLQGTAQQISADVETLIKEMNSSIDEANAFIAQMQTK
jgi:uncharacterized protein YukE